MTRRRVAVIFDDRVRPETTGVYCRRALARMADVEHFRPDELAQIPANRFDLYVNIDDGLRYVLPAHLRPAVWWAIDTHLDGNWSVQKAATFDGVFTAQRAGVELMRSAGIRNVHWLPLACDPEFHQRYDVSKRFDVCFVGNLMPGPRVELIQRLQAKFSSMYVGRDYFHAMAQRYSESRVVFNRSVGPDINMRVFETLACGSLLVTNDLSSDGLNEFFQDGVHLATYRDAEELLERVAFYLEHETQRECIAATGRSEVLAKHTYEHRMRHLLEITSAWSASQRQKRSAPGRLIDHQRDQSVGINVRTPSVPAVARPLTNKSPHYFRHPRPEVANLVPSDATHILDVGCGIGCLGEALRQRQRCRVVGIELDSKAATEAERRLDLVLQGNVESDPFEFPAATFDCIICADVLEHTREPLHVLRRVHQWLSAGGCLVLSIPNVRHLDVITSLAEGRWEYESAGLLDEDHVRFFCRSDVERLLYRAGFEIDRQEVVPGPGHQAWLDAGRPLVLEARGVTVRCTSPEEAEEFFAYQYVIRARRRNLSKEILRNRLIDRHSDDFSSAGIETLRKQYSWPARRPCVPFPAQHSGWFIDGARLILARVLGRHVRVVVEVGSWLGASTRFIADQAPQATVIAIDHWQGSPEHQTRTPWNVLLGHLYETFVALNDQYRDRIVPVRCEAQQGLKLIAELGISPDVIYLDSDHSYQSTRDLIALCRVLFPESVLVGDDFDAGGVQQAVEEVAKNQCLEVATRGTQWRAWMLTSPGQMEPARESIDDHGLTSIIIATYNQLACTQACLESIRMRTDEPYEVIVVDNGSTDGTPAFLKQYPEITLIPNQANRGFPAAMNQGLRAARGRNLLLLNNDTVVTTGWLTRLLGALHSEPCIGVVGPVSNQVSGPQQIPVTYQNLSQLDSFAWQHGKRFSGLVEPSARLVGFCLLFRREVLERIGVLDERFGVGCFEDDDYCLRARQAGFETVIANDAFVHHSGSQTFRHSAVDLDRLMSRNRRKFEEKWGLRGSEPLLILGQPATGYREATSAQNEPLLERRPLPLSLCMIVRDNESTIRPCLESIRPWVDEIVVVDTGSRDRTPEICRELGAKVHFFDWCDDFAAARNESLMYARGEWVFWMDSDDTISPDCGQRLRELAVGTHESGVQGYVLQVHCPGTATNGSDQSTIVDHVKLFRNGLGLAFEGRIHEQIIPSIRRIGGGVEWTDIYVAHSGADRSSEGRQRKLERDYRLLQLDLQERPNHPFVLFNLGMTYLDEGRYREAIDVLIRCIEVSTPEESHLRKAYSLLVAAHAGAGATTESYGCCCDGLAIYPDDEELLFRKAGIDHNEGRLHEAFAAYRRLLDGERARHFTSIDSEITGRKARHNLALVLYELGRWAESAEEWLKILKLCPSYRPAARGAGDALLKLADHGRVESLIEMLQASPEYHDIILRLQGGLAEQAGDTHTAGVALVRAAQCSDDPEIQHACCASLFQHELFEKAQQALERLTVMVPDDASAHHNLAAVYLRLGKYSEAVVCFNRSLELRPDAPETRRLYGVAVGEESTARNAVWLDDEPSDLMQSGGAIHAS